MRALSVTLLPILLAATSCWAGTELSFYGGSARIGASQIIETDPSSVNSFSFGTHWQGQYAKAHSEFGVRLTWWQSEFRGWGLDLSTTAATANPGTLAPNGLSDLQFSDGVSLLTMNTYRRWPDIGALTAYVGAGMGIAVPRVEFDARRAREDALQLTGPAMRWMAGASYPVSDHWSVFGEYRGSFSFSSAQLQSGEAFRSDTVNGGVNFGLTFDF